jgi:hypothetical protein
MINFYLNPIMSSRRKIIPSSVGVKRMENMMTQLKIGVVGYSGRMFSTDEAQRLLEELFDQVIHEHPKATSFVVVSGLTALGIPDLAYHEAVRRGWQTEGIACSKAKEYKCFPVDKCTIIGNKWGEESEFFLSNIDVIVRIGGGIQSLAEVQAFEDRGGKAYERELAALPN